MIKIKELLTKIKYIKFIGNDELEFNKVIPITELNNVESAISWCGDKNEDILNDINSESIVIIVSKANKQAYKLKNYIVVDNPRRTFQEILTKFFAKKREKQIHSSAKIHPTAKISDNVTIGYNVVIEEGCVIGTNTTILHNTVVFYDSVIGENVNIGSNDTIGGIGFGYEKNKNKKFELIPHIGNVVIKDNVDIGNNTCIDRAVLGSTIIEENVKIDNLVHIAHGVKVGRNSVVIANAMVAGSVNIGENSWVAPSSSILNKRDVGNNALVGMGAVVTKNVEEYAIVAGNPAKFVRSLK